MTAELARWEFVWPLLLAALPLPLLAAWLLPAARHRAAGALRVPFATELHTLAAGGARRAKARPLLLPLVAWALLCVAAARPQILGDVTQPPQTGRDLLLAVDLSGSMQEEDMQLGAYVVDRLTAVKAVLGDFLDRRVGDRVGLLVFGQRAYAVTPLTPDRDAVRQQLDETVVGLAGQETAIGDAIALAVKRLTRAGEPADGAPAGATEVANASRPEQAPEDLPKEKVVILLTDGVNTAGTVPPDKAAELARTADVRVHTIGFGGDSGGGFWSLPQRASIDEATLQSIAETTGGRYFRARDTNELAGIYAELDRIEPAARAGEVQRPRIERYHVPLAGALAVALLALAWHQLPRRLA